MSHEAYNSPLWDLARSRALRRDGNRCTVARLLGGRCSPSLHVHHIVPLSEGGAAYDADNLGTVCSAHHPSWEGLRRAVIERRASDRPRCPHRHVTREGREACERRMARRAAVAA